MTGIVGSFRSRSCLEDEPGRDGSGENGLPPVRMASQSLGFMLQQPDLAVKPPAIAAQAAVGGNHAMARHDDRDWIAAVRSADRPARTRLADRLASSAYEIARPYGMVHSSCQTRF